MGVSYGYPYHMKTTVEIEDRLFERAKAQAAREGITLKALINRALRSLLAPRPANAKSYDLDYPVVHDERPAAVDVADRKALYDVMEDR